MKVYGITGGVGCGKSTVLELIRDNFNAYIVKADDVSRNILDKGTLGYQKVLCEFGREILLRDGTINRGMLAQIVFNDSRKLKVLNNIVHPLVKEQILREIELKRIQGEYDYFIVEAALLFEDNYDKFCDETWYIYADKETRVKRLLASRGYSEDKTESIMRNQLSEDEFRCRCDRALDNSGDVDKTLEQLKKMLVAK